MGDKELAKAILKKLIRPRYVDEHVPELERRMKLVEHELKKEQIGFIYLEELHLINPDIFLTGREAPPPERVKPTKPSDCPRCPKKKGRMRKLDVIKFEAV